jgi:hypothetical protein
MRYLFFLLLQWLQERALMLRYACIAYLVGRAFKNTAKSLIFRDLTKACVSICVFFFILKISYPLLLNNSKLEQ